MTGRLRRGGLALGLPPARPRSAGRASTRSPSGSRSRRTRSAAGRRTPSSDEARDLHRRLLVVDLHADTLLWGRDLLVRARSRSPRRAAAGRGRHRARGPGGLHEGPARGQPRAQRRPERRRHPARDRPALAAGDVAQPPGASALPRPSSPGDGRPLRRPAHPHRHAGRPRRLPRPAAGRPRRSARRSSRSRAPMPSTGTRPTSTGWSSWATGWCRRPTSSTTPSAAPRTGSRRAG